MNTEADLENVRRHYGAEVYWLRDGLVHRCGGSEVHPGTFLLWPICGEGDVPAGAGFKSDDAKVSCLACLTALQAGTPVPSRVPGGHK